MRMGRRMYAALIPARASPIREPAAQKNILRSPSRSPDTRKAFMKHMTEAVSESMEISPKTMARIVSSLPICTPIYEYFTVKL